MGMMKALAMEAEDFGVNTNQPLSEVISQVKQAKLKIEDAFVMHCAEIAVANDVGTYQAWAWDKVNGDKNVFRR